MRAIAWQLPVALSLAALGLTVIGPSTGAAPAVALAAIAPELARVDIAERRLPNRMVVPGLALGLAVQLVTLGMSARVPIVPLATAVGVGGVLLVLSLLGGMGMGDVKLAALIGLASPTPLLAVAAPLLAFLAGGVASAALLARGARGRRIAFGPYLLAGWAGSLVVSLLMTAR